MWSKNIHGLIKNLGVILFIYFTLFSLFFSCAHLDSKKAYHDHLSEMKQLYENSIDSPVPNENFIFLKKYVLGNEEAPCKETDDPFAIIIDPGVGKLKKSIQFENPKRRKKL